MRRRTFRWRNNIAGIVILVTSAWLSPHHAAGATLDREASRVAAMAIANMARIQTLSYDLSTVSQALDGRGALIGGETRHDEQVTCDRGAKLLRWSSPAPKRRGYVADARRHTLVIREGSATTFSDTSPPEQVESMALPYPGWVWRPEEVIPSVPGAVAQEGTAVILASGTEHPRVRCWIDRTSGTLLKFTVTDVTGYEERSVELRGWTRINGVWVPGQVVEEIRGSVRGLRRVMTFGDVSINPTVAAGTFSTP